MPCARPRARSPRATQSSVRRSSRSRCSRCRRSRSRTHQSWPHPSSRSPWQSADGVLERGDVGVGQFARAGRRGSGRGRARPRRRRTTTCDVGLTRTRPARTSSSGGSSGPDPLARVVCSCQRVWRRYFFACLSGASGHSSRDSASRVCARPRCRTQVAEQLQRLGREDRHGPVVAQHGDPAEQPHLQTGGQRAPLQYRPTTGARTVATRRVPRARPESGPTHERSRPAGRGAVTASDSGLRRSVVFGPLLRRRRSPPAPRPENGARCPGRRCRRRGPACARRWRRAPRWPTCRRPSSTPPAERVWLRTLSPNEAVYRAGDPGDAMFVVASGPDRGPAAARPTATRSTWRPCAAGRCSATWSCSTGAAARPTRSRSRRAGWSSSAAAAAARLFASSPGPRARPRPGHGPDRPRAHRQWLHEQASSTRCTARLARFLLAAAGADGPRPPRGPPGAPRPAARDRPADLEQIAAPPGHRRSGRRRPERTRRHDPRPARPRRR